MALTKLQKRTREQLLVNLRELRLEEGSDHEKAAAALSACHDDEALVDLVAVVVGRHIRRHFRPIELSPDAPGPTTRRYLTAWLSG